MAMVYNLIDTVEVLSKLCDVEVLPLYDRETRVQPALPRLGPNNLHFLN